jgi:hydroxyethylthiazole kinase-like uncharacterized protein yjeF
MSHLIGSHPILSCAEAVEFERAWFQGNEAREWAAMKQAGQALGHRLLEDLEIAGIDQGGASRALVLVGKGHNGGDAMLAAVEMLRVNPAWRIEVGFVFGQNRLRPLALAAWRTLFAAGGSSRVTAVRLEHVQGKYTVIVDGIFGFQYRPPLPEIARRWIETSQQVEAKVSVAVDLPSGWDAAGGFVADVTYVTGIFKSPLLNLPVAGRLRYLDLGFETGEIAAAQRVLTPALLGPLRGLRSFRSDKRSFGHLAVIGGSRSFPGAVAMSVAAALLSGVGLVTAFVPESLAPAWAARWPEAMWVGCPETPDGNIAMESGLSIRTKSARITAMLIGPGLGREPETMALVADLLRETRVPLVLDADALQPELIELGNTPRVLTPHQGEFDRITARQPAGAWPAKAITVLKGPITRIHDLGTTYFGVEGGPVLARGGSGDILAGLIGGRLAANPTDLLAAAAQGVVWQGRAAHRVARKHGEFSVRTTAILDELNGALHHE